MRKKGFINYFDSKKKYGFTEDNIYFFFTDILNLNDFVLNTFENKYEIEYDLEKSDIKVGSVCAKNILIVNEIPKIEKSNLVPAEELGVQEGYIILYMSTKKVGYIISSAEYKKKTKGDIYFSIDDVETEIDIDTFKFHYKVTYNIYFLGTKKIAKNIKIIEKIGLEESFRITSRKSLLLPGMSNIVSYNDILDESGIQALEEQIRASDIANEENVKYGLVFYYIQNKNAFIVNYYISPQYRMNQKIKSDWSFVFIPQLVKPDISAVGRINTGKYVYLVSFKETGGDVHEIKFLSKIVKNKIIRIVVEQKIDIHDTYIKLAYVDDEPAIEDEELAIGKLSNIASLNSMVDMRLRVGNVEQCIKCLQLIEISKKNIKIEDYYRLKLRLLPVIYKSVREDKYRKAIISCCSELLKLPQKDTYKLTLLLEKANKQRQGGEYNAAINSYKAWLNYYKTIIETSPEKEGGLKVAYYQATRGLEQCQNINDLSTGHQDESYTIEVSTEDNSDSLLLEVMDIVEKQARGRTLDAKWKKYEHVLEVSDDEILKLDNELMSDDLSKYSESSLWALSNIYLILLSDEKYMKDEIKLFIFEQLVKYALFKRAMSVSDCAQKQYYIFMKSFNEEEPEDVCAIIGSIYMQHKELIFALEGNVGLEEVIARGLEMENSDRFVRGMIVLSAKSEFIKRTIEETLDNIELVDSEDYKSKLHKQITKYGANGSGLVDCFEQSVTNYIAFRNEFDHIAYDSNISVIAHKYREILYDKSTEAWFEGESITREDLRELFISIDNYDNYKGFPEKSGQIKKASEATNKILNRIQNRPGLFICDVYKKSLEKYCQCLLSAYQKLCKTSKPILQIGETKIENEGGKYRLNIPIIPGKNYAQDAINVILIVQKQEGIRTDNEVIVSSRIPSDGNTVWAEVPLEVIKTDNKFASIEIQIKYEYISDIKFLTKKYWRNKKRTVVSSEEHISEGFYPNDKEFKKIEFVLAQTVKRHIINTDRLKKFPKDGGKINLDDIEIKKILENREKSIKEAINGLTINDNENKLSQIGRWVILYGQWRVGKSLILKCVEEYLSDKEKFPHTLVVSLNCITGDTKDFENTLASTIYNAIALNVRKSNYQDVFNEISAELCISRGQKPTWSELRDFLQLFISDIREKQEDFAIVILLDEFTNIYEAIIRGNVKERFPAEWTELINKTNVLCVTAGGEHTVSLMTTYSPNTIQKSDANVRVSYLLKEDVDAYVRYIMGEGPTDNVSQDESYFGVKSPEAIDRIYELTGGNAYILQRYCTWLIEYMNENKTQFLSKYVVDSALNYLVNQPAMDMESLENDLFNSLYNPFNETGGTQYLHDVKRIEDDQVKDDNLQILHEIVAIASTGSHMCSFTELEESMKTKMDIEVFRRRYNTLVQRGIITEYHNGNFKILIDLYYEIVSRLERVK